MEKFKKGDKFVIEIEEVYDASNACELDVDNKLPLKLYKMKNFNSLVFDINGLKRLDRLDDKKLQEAFESCYEQGYSDGRISVVFDIMNEDLEDESDDSEVSCDHCSCEKDDNDEEDMLNYFLEALFG